MEIQPHLSGAMPEAWPMRSLDDAAHFYKCSLLLAQILESPPSDRIVHSFFEWASPKHNVLLNQVLHLEPDIQSARQMCAMSRYEFAEQTIALEYEVEMMEENIIPVTLGEGMLICRFLGWPLGALFRDAEMHWHRRTFLGLMLRNPEGF